ncbi:MAG: hypothetical protein QF886_20290, partial [Planctomycetota bacterium]|nr:hypothetical protein [Planctomycetota bacterium]
MNHRALISLFASILLICPLSAETKKHEYLVGGPLAGVKLPLFPTQHGEPEGHPGVTGQILEIKRGDKVSQIEFTTEGLPPQFQLYPGSIENYRAYMFKYMKIRSFFDVQSQIKNWRASEIPGVEKSEVEEYAAPIFWVPRHKPVYDTGLKNKPVKVVRCKINAPVFQLDLGELNQGLYAVRVIGAVEPSQCTPFRKPAFFRMSVNDGLKGEPSSYRIRIGYCEEFYGIAEFYFHAVEKRHFKAELALDKVSTVDLLVHYITLDDALTGIDRRMIKEGTTIKSGREIAEATLKRRKKQGHAVAEPRSRQARLARDAALWNRFPATNAQASQAFSTGYGSIRGVTDGTDKLPSKQILDQFGSWQTVDLDRKPKGYPKELKNDDIIMYNP